MKKKVRLIIVEDHRILREGLKALLSSVPGLDIAGEAENGLEAVKKVTRIRPDLVLIDLSMPKMDGLDAIGEIKQRYPEVKVLVLTVHKQEEYVFASLQAGADGYLLKDATSGELRLAIESVMDGKLFVSPGISQTLVQGYLKGKQTSVRDSRLNLLTKREKQILKMIARGQKNREIARDLCISVKTVEKHRSNFMKKLDLHNASEITSFAIEQGLIRKSME